MDRRVCKACGQPVALVNYYLDSRTKKPMAVCKKCHRARCKKNETPEQRRRWRANRKPRELTEADREKARLAQAKYRAANKDKLAARAMVYDFLRRRILSRPRRCEACPSSRLSRLQVHHLDFARPLYFVWVHRGCGPLVASGELQLSPEILAEAWEREGKLLEELRFLRGSVSRRYEELKALRNG